MLYQLMSRIESAIDSFIKKHLPPCAVHYLMNRESVCRYIFLCDSIIKPCLYDDGSTPLHKLAAMNYDDVAYHRRSGSVFNDDGSTPLHILALKGNKHVINHRNAYIVRSLHYLHSGQTPYEILNKYYCVTCSDIICASTYEPYSPTWKDRTICLRALINGIADEKILFGGFKYFIIYMIWMSAFLFVIVGHTSNFIVVMLH